MLYNTVVTTGIILVDHGSRLAESNLLLEQVASALSETYFDEFPIVEPAHMEIAEPSIATAYAHCVRRGAQRIVVCPYFLGPGKHWTRDIPRLTAEAQQKHPTTTFHITATLGLDDLMLQLIRKRITQCRVVDYHCEKCAGSERCGPAIRQKLAPGAK